MASWHFIYLAIIIILCICVGFISLESDDEKYKKLVTKIFRMPADDPYFASNLTNDTDKKINDWRLDEKCNAVCVTKHLCVNNTVVVDGAGMLSLRMANPFGANGDSNCGSDVLCCLNEDGEYDEGDEDDEDDETNEYENTSNESTNSPDDEKKIVTMGCGFRYDRKIEAISSRISSGTTTYLGEYPWIVAVGLRSRNRDYFQYRGGGSLIHPRVILTAAHILQNRTAEDFLIRAGEWDMQNTNEEFKHQDRSVALIFRHTRFEAATLINDIALVIVKQPFELTQTVNTICLPKPNFSAKHNTKCTASGWGINVGDGKYQSILRKVDVPYVARRECQQKLRRTRLGVFYRLHRSLVCAGGRKGDDACEGDGGSPLVSELPITESRFYQIGIVAGGKLHWSREKIQRTKSNPNFTLALIE